jgi:hypothetical protein
MASLETAKPATDQDTRTLSEIQASRLNRRFGFALDTAVVIASLAWGIAR